MAYIYDNSIKAPKDLKIFVIIYALYFPLGILGPLGQLAKIDPFIEPHPLTLIKPFGIWLSLIFIYKNKHYGAWGFLFFANIEIIFAGMGFTKVYTMLIPHNFVFWIQAYVVLRVTKLTEVKPNVNNQQLIVYGALIFLIAICFGLVNNQNPTWIDTNDI